MSQKEESILTLFKELSEREEKVLTMYFGLGGKWDEPIYILFDNISKMAEMYRKRLLAIKN